jgi:hypothetical protein
MILQTVLLSTLIDRALKQVRGPYEVGRPIARSASLDAVQTTFTLVGTVAPLEMLEFGSELMLVTARNSDPDPIYTVIRGYYGSTAVAHGANEAGLAGPIFSRQAAKDGVIASFPCLEANDVTIVQSAIFTPIIDPADTLEGRVIVAMPAETRDVLNVAYGLDELPRWRFFEGVPTATYSTGKVIFLPFGWPTTGGDLQVKYTTPYRWSGHLSGGDPTDETESVQLPEEAVRLPSTYAAAWVLQGREVSRTEIDRSEEWARTEPLRGGVSGQVVQRHWQKFYRDLDEAKRVDPPLPHRPIVTWNQR